MAFYFRPPDSYDEEGVRKHFAKPGVAGLLGKCVEVLSSIPEWTIDACDRAYTELAQREGVGRGKLIHPTRLALSGKTFGPGLFDIMYVLGRDETISRLNDAIKFIETLQ
jgi:glutamyl-tRNA synthetase